MIWYGNGNNGKSGMESIVEHAFGDYCYKVPTSLFSSRRTSFSQATPELIKLKKYLLYAFTITKNILFLREDTTANGFLITNETPLPINSPFWVI